MTKQAEVVGKQKSMPDRQNCGEPCRRAGQHKENMWREQNTIPFLCDCSRIFVPERTILSCEHKNVPGQNASAASLPHTHTKNQVLGTNTTTTLFEGPLIAPNRLLAHSPHGTLVGTYSQGGRKHTAQDKSRKETFPLFQGPPSLVRLLSVLLPSSLAKPPEDFCRRAQNPNRLATLLKEQEEGRNGFVGLEAIFALVASWLQMFDYLPP